MSSLFTTESVTEGHPDKVSDLIADAVLDAHLEVDPNSRVACEVLCKSGEVILAGEINSQAQPDLEAVVRAAVKSTGYCGPGEPFSSSNLRITNFLGRQSERISGGIDLFDKKLGAGDQGFVFGYATDETPELMPQSVILAHKVTRILAEHRKTGKATFLRPDGKSQITVLQNSGRTLEVKAVVVSAQHTSDVGLDVVRDYIATIVLPEALGHWYGPKIRVFINPAGVFDLGGPEADCGVTGRKIIVDTYGGAARHGGGAFSGKDASKVDRSAAYFARFVARQIVKRGLAKEAEIQVAYAIGVPEPVSISVDCRGTGSNQTAGAFAQQFDFRPAAIIEQLGLKRPCFAATTNYGHFGKPGLEWEI